MSEPEYKITKEDVAKALALLRLSFPNIATPEIAVRLLSLLRENNQNIEDLGNDEIEKYLLDLEEH